MEGIRGGRNFDWAAARQRVLSQYLSADEIEKYYSVVKPQIEENNWNGTQIMIGAKNFMFDRQTEIHKTMGAVIASAKWAGERMELVGGVVGRLLTGKQAPELHGWRELYTKQTAYRNQQVVDHYSPLRDVYDTIAANPDAAMGAGMTIAMQDDVLRGRYAAATGMFAAETVATGIVGRAVGAARMGLQAMQMRSAARWSEAAWGWTRQAENSSSWLLAEAGSVMTKRIASVQQTAARKLVQESFTSITAKECADSPAIQREVYAMAQQWKAEQEAFMSGIMREHNISGQFSNMLKRDGFDEFVGGILEKTARKEYSTIGQMDDIVRGRVNVDSWDDAVKLQNILESQSGHLVSTDPKRALTFGNGLAGYGYPRFHAIMQRSTGITHEWQIGTRAVTEVFETPGIALPKGLQLKAGMKTDLHDIEYDIFAPLMKQAPRFANSFGIPAFRNQVDMVAARAGRLGSSYPANQMVQDIQRLHLEAGQILDALYRRGGQSLIERFFH